MPNIEDHRTINKIDDLIAQITSQDELNDILNIVIDQRRILARKTKRSLEPGLKVLIQGNKKGSGIIVKVNKTRCQVRLDSDGKIWNVPISMIRAEETNNE